MNKRRKLTAEEQSWADNLKRLWGARRPPLGETKKMSQEKAAELAGWGAQSTVSQYINGVIPLNTDAILTFSKLIPCAAKEINPEFAVMLKNQQHAEIQQKFFALLEEVGEEKHDALIQMVEIYARGLKESTE